MDANNAPPPNAKNRAYSKTPADLAALLVQFDAKVRRGDVRSLRTGIAPVDAAVRTMWQGSLTLVVGRPSNRKSSLLKHMARLECQRIVAEGRQGRECVVFLTLEESDLKVALALAGAPFGPLDIVEGRVPPDVIRLWQDRILELPVMTVGHERTDLSRAAVPKPPPLTVEQAYREAEQMVADLERQPAALFVDYVQKAAVETRRETEKAQRVAYAVGQIVEIAKGLNVPAVVAAQAGREVDKMTPPLPGLADVQWSSQLEQDADVFLSLWYPCKLEREHRGRVEAAIAARSGVMDFTNGKLTASRLFEPDVMVIGCRKQRDAVGGQCWATKVDPVAGVFSDLEIPPIRADAHTSYVPGMAEEWA